LELKITYIELKIPKKNEAKGINIGAASKFPNLYTDSSQMKNNDLQYFYHKVCLFPNNIFFQIPKKQRIIKRRNMQDQLNALIQKSNNRMFK